MRTWWRNLRTALPRHRRTPRPRAFRPALLALDDRCLPSAAGGFVQTNLVSDIQGLAATFDKNLVNPWGLVAGPATPWWVSDNGAGVSTLYNGAGVPQPQPTPANPNAKPLVVTIPPPTTTPPTPQATPTGVVFNGTTDFAVGTNPATHQPAPAVFIFVTEDGTVSGWNPAVDGTHAILKVDNPDQTNGPVFKGATLDQMGTANFLYVADFRKGTIDVFDKNFAKVTTLPAGAFTDPKIPAGFAPFNIQNINGKLYVTYAKQDAAKHDDVAGQGNGFVDVFNPDGTPGLPGGKERLITRGQLDSPWGLALAPGTFGSLSNDLLVGNFGNGHINAFDPGNGHFLGDLKDAAGRPITINGLWALRFGNGAAAGPTNTLFFTAGIGDESHGLFGSLQVIPTLHQKAPIVTNLASPPTQTFSTVPANGDVNPYGVAFVPQDFKGGGALQPGDILVSNFNNKANQQGTGSTIVRITPTGEHTVFFPGQPGTPLGLTTALGVLKGGFVLVGNVPTTDGTFATIQPGSLLILDSSGKVVSTLTDNKLLDGPWDLAIDDDGGHASVFVSNVLSGTVTRLDLRIPSHGAPVLESATQIASGYTHRSDAAALVVGPTGLAFDDKKDVLYVASTGDNAVYAIANAEDTRSDRGKGTLVFSDSAHLHGPLGLVLAPNGDLIATNGDAVNASAAHPSTLVEFTPKGKFVGEFSIDAASGAAFGLAVDETNGVLRLAAVNDDTNTLEVWTFDVKG